eukprot:TRINITY_DN16644_c0_g1_i2.p2 TRINITY_DN16644_c0_g1~~TRINITY_DN16644_c0_g1_i2.p2  ORF type:complete len:215 (+),score=44.15 TRINITY_DN16644_c0_g1_i2:353-997(+)
MENLVNDSSRILSQTIRAFREMPSILKIAEQVKGEVEKFKRYVPLALALRTEGMKNRHWDEISSMVGFEVRPKEGFTMTTVINMNLIDYLSEIERVSEKAAKEYAIEMNLINMKKSWEKIDFKLFPWKNSGTWIVAQISFEDINALIDENMVLTQQMMSSRKASSERSVQGDICDGHRGVEQDTDEDVELNGGVGGAAEDVACTPTHLRLPHHR